MIYGIYTIKDSVTGKFGDIYVAINDQQAERQFGIICSKSDIYADLSLYKLGEYDLDTGVIKSEVVFVKNGVDYEKQL